MLMDVHEIRRTNLQQLASDYGGPTTLGDKLDRSQSQVSQLLSSKVMGSKLARHIEDCLGLHHGWLDQLHGMEAREEMTKYRGGGARSTMEDKKRAAWMRLFDELEKEGKSDAALRLLMWLLNCDEKTAQKKAMELIFEDAQNKKRHRQSRGKI